MDSFDHIHYVGLFTKYVCGKFTGQLLQLSPLQILEHHLLPPTTGHLSLTCDIRSIKPSV